MVPVFKLSRPPSSVPQKLLFRKLREALSHIMSQREVARVSLADMTRMMAGGNESEVFNQPKCAVCNIIETDERKLLTCARCKKTRYCSKSPSLQDQTHRINPSQARTAKQRTGKATSQPAQRKTIFSKSPSAPPKSPTPR